MTFNNIYHPWVVVAYIWSSWPCINTIQHLWQLHKLDKTRKCTLNNIFKCRMHVFWHVYGYCTLSFIKKIINSACMLARGRMFITTWYNIFNSDLLDTNESSCHLCECTSPWLNMPWNLLTSQYKLSAMKIWVYIIFSHISYTTFDFPIVTSAWANSVCGHDFSQA
jgi:hypothetical protein